MTYLNIANRAAPRRSLSEWIDAFGAAFGDYLYRYGRLDQVDALRAKSDAELAGMGLTRDRIVHHVFRDRMGF
jgi:hypothetical protein